jgi:hypothetical protein
VRRATHGCSCRYESSGNASQCALGPVQSQRQLRLGGVRVLDQGPPQRGKEWVGLPLDLGKRGVASGAGIDVGSDGFQRLALKLTQNKIAKLVGGGALHLIHGCNSGKKNGLRSPVDCPRPPRRQGGHIPLVYWY